MIQAASDFSGSLFLIVELQFSPSLLMLQPPEK